MKDPNNISLVWTFEDWEQMEKKSTSHLNKMENELKMKEHLVNLARLVLRAHSTSFFIVTRFLPKTKRDNVELIYCAVRYPDEIVDSFKINKQKKKTLLYEWSEKYELGLRSNSIKESVQNNVPFPISGFTQLIKNYNIPYHYYRSFIDAMIRDSNPQPFSNIEDLIENYIYGSAIVVGYFLAYVYGSINKGSFPLAIESSRNLGIALQLTNFIRDIDEDRNRGRCYIPTDILHQVGLNYEDFFYYTDEEKIIEARKIMAKIADEYYEKSLTGLKYFSKDSHVAIRSCTYLYRKLNQRILISKKSISHRESLSIIEKLTALPFSKYWKLPMSYLKK
ncbi:MAG: hypothetical protein CL764_06140 [Chloroflexi bacterium]|nr:hypothetical protein [Chloroflexota bacterium]|tara:strand:+ start:906 stop:1913 length:1008 start_codon:yes stop_codon:yes gene_type:complete